MLARQTLCLVLLVGSIGALNAADRIRMGPKVLRSGDHGVGERAPEIRFRDLERVTHDLGLLSGSHRAVVVAMTSTTCPLSKKYFPTLLNLAEKYSDEDVHFVIVNAVPTDKVSAMKRAQIQLGDSATYVFDKLGVFTRSIGAQTTTDTLLIDGNGTVVYHGAIDDQYGFGYSLESAASPFFGRRNRIAVGG